MGEEGLPDVDKRALDSPDETGRLITLWFAAPAISAVPSYLLYRFVLAG